MSNDSIEAPAPNRSGNEPFESILNRRISRRGLVKAAAIGAPVIALSTSPLLGSRIFGGASLSSIASADGHSDGGGLSTLGIESIPHDLDDAINIAPGYAADVLIRWGDPVEPGAPTFDLNNQTAASAARQFGFNCDYVGFLPLDPGSTRFGLLSVNHEYTRGGDMFPGYDGENPTAEQVAVEIANHGLSVVRVSQRGNGSWYYHADSYYNRRIHGETLMVPTGPAAGSAHLQTSADPTGTDIRGMFNNCGGGKTPWGTILTCEENFHQYFGNNDSVEEAAQARNARYGAPGGESWRKWERFESRFDLGQEPNEINRHGYVVEIDPYDPHSTPRKHTALGRFKHEAANTTLSDDNRVVVYSGDDQRFDYMYKFVSRNTFNPYNRAENLKLLEEGTLYVAKLDDSGSGEWIPLVPTGPLSDWSLADISVFTREAADLVGATPMDRPEDIEVNPVNRRVYVALTNNTRRTAEQIDGPNPRGPNAYGHILEITENDGDAASTKFTWDIFIICGDPAVEEHGTYFAGFDQSQLDSLAAPDNVAFDRAGNLWITTDGQPRSLEAADAAYVVPTAGPERGRVRRFLTGVPGGEVTGPEFTPDDTALFLAIQHPGEGGGLDEPTSTWPDGDFPRPSVIVTRKLDGGVIGS